MEGLASLGCAGDDIDVGVLGLDGFLGENWHALVTDFKRVALFIGILEKLHVGYFTAGNSCLDLDIAIKAIFDLACVCSIFVSGCRC